MVGNWDNSAYGKKLKAHYNQFPNLYFYDPIYELATLDLLRSNAQYYIHGHSAGGTNPSLVEAMYLGLPILSFDVIYNRATTNNQAVYFNNVNELRQLLRQIDRLPLIAIGQNLQDFAYKKYLWVDISQRYAQLFDGVEAKEVLLPEYTKSAFPDPELLIRSINKKSTKQNTQPIPKVYKKPATPSPLVSTNN